MKFTQNPILLSILSKKGVIAYIKAVENIWEIILLTAIDIFY